MESDIGMEGVVTSAAENVPAAVTPEIEAGQTETATDAEIKAISQSRRGTADGPSAAAVEAVSPEKIAPSTTESPAVATEAVTEEVAAAQLSDAPADEPVADGASGAETELGAQDFAPAATEPAAEGSAIAAEATTDSIPASQASGATSHTTSKRAVATSLKRIGTELVPQVKLEKWQLDEAAERLSKPKERKEEANRKAKAVQLKYEFDKSLRGGKGGYKETLVPAKKVTAQAKQDYMVSLAARCQETSQKTKAALKEKYLQPLNPNAKKIAAGEEMEAHMAKIDKLYHGEGVSG